MHEVAVDSYCEQNNHNYRMHYVIQRLAYSQAIITNAFKFHSCFSFQPFHSIPDDGLRISRNVE